MGEIDGVPIAIELDGELVDSNDPVERIRECAAVWSQGGNPSENCIEYLRCNIRGYIAAWYQCFVLFASCYWALP